VRDGDNAKTEYPTLCVNNSFFICVMAILFSEAFNSQHEIVKIANAKRGEKYYCPDCGKPLFPKLRGIERAPHFAHFEANEKCSPDRWLHNTLRDLLYRRIKENRDISVIRNSKERINISKWDKCEKEVNVGGFIPDIYLIVDGIEYFIEICVTHPCSAEKIAQGKRIIELYTENQECKEELEKGDIVCNAKNYSVRFHNFTDNTRMAEAPKAVSFPISTPFHTHEAVSRNDFYHHEIEASTPISDKDYNRYQHNAPIIPKREFSPENKTQNPPPFIFHYVLFPDSSEELLYVGVDRSMLRVKPDAILELGIGIADGVFAKEVGRRYAADKGLLAKESLSQTELGFDMVAIKEYLGFSEIL